MKLRPFLTVLLAIAFVLVSASGVGAIWLSRQSPLRLSEKRIESGPEAALFVSRQAPLMLSLQVNPDRLKAYRLTNVPLGERAQIQAQFDRWQRRLLGEPKLSYGDDIAPWAADEMTLALMNPDVDRDASNGQQPGYLLAVEVADPAQAKTSLQRFWSSQAAARNQIKEFYSGIELTYANPESRRRSNAETEIELPALTTAIVSDQFVLFANYPKVLRQALNNVQVAELSLNADQTYQQAVNLLSDRRIGMAFVNLPQFATWLTAERTEPIDTRLIAALQPTPEGMLAKLTLLSPEKTSSKSEELSPENRLNSLSNSLFNADTATDSPDRPAADAKAILQDLPANSAFVLSGMNVGQTWQQVQQSNLSWTTPMRAAIDRLQQTWGIDFAADLFPWMPGEFALSLIPRSESSGTGLLQAFDAAFITRQSADIATGLDKLNAIAAQQGLSSGAFQLNDQTISAWTKLTPLQSKDSLALEATVQGLHAQIGDHQVFATSVEAMRQIIEARTAETPALLQQTIARLNQADVEIDQSGDRYQGYVDWTLFRSRYGDQPTVQRLEQTVKPLFESLQSVAFRLNVSESNPNEQQSPEADRSLGALLLRFQEQR